MRPYIPCILLALVLLSGTLFSAFSVDKYFYPQENMSIVVTENFTAVNSSYVLVKINNTEAFLLKGGEPVTNASEIEAAIRDYYKKKYAPGPDELGNITSQLQLFDASRNDGGKWKGQEEDVCRRYLLLDGYISFKGQKLYCTNGDAENCSRIAQTVYNAPYTESIRQNWPYQTFYDQFIQFATASNDMESTVHSDYALLGNITDDNLAASLQKVKDSIPKLRQDATNVQNTLFRTPRDNADREACTAPTLVTQKCAWICPDLTINTDLLDQLNSKISNFVQGIGPFANYKAVAASLAANTNSRISFREGEDKAVVYSAKFAPMHSDTESTVRYADEVTTYVNDATFKSKLQQLKDMDAGINTSIAKRNFSSIDTELENYAALNTYIENKSIEVMAVYKDTLAERDKAAVLVFAINSKSDLSPQLKERFNEVLNVTSVLDSQFNKGLTPDNFNRLRGGYTNTSTQMASILQTQQEQDLFGRFIEVSKFRSLARRVNTGIYNVSTMSGQTEPVELSKNAQYVPIAFSGMSLLSFSALAIFVFLGILAVRKPYNNMSMAFYSGGLLLVLAGILLFSIIFYLCMDWTSNNASMEEFLISMNGEKNVSVVLELGDAPPAAAAQNMKACADQLKSALTAGNRTVAMHEVYAVKCTVNGVETTANSSACMPSPQKPTFVLKYSAVPSKPSLSAVYSKRATLSGDESYFKSCQIAAVFRK